MGSSSYSSSLIDLQMQAFAVYRERFSTENLEAKSFDEWCAVIIHNFFTGAKPLNWKFVPPVYEITTSRKLFDVCGSARQYHTLDVWYGSFPLC